MFIFYKYFEETRLFVYSWASDDIPDERRGIYLGVKEEFRSIRQIYTCKTNDSGIVNIKSIDDVKSGFDQCLSQANMIVPNNKKSSAYISLGATSALRNFKYTHLKRNFLLFPSCWIINLILKVNRTKCLIWLEVILIQADFCMKIQVKFKF